jgi:hypothetical protein
MVIFLSYAKEDSTRVSGFYETLKQSGYTPWMDVHDILPGQDWKFEIQNAISACDAAVVFLSTRSVSKTGYVQAELAEFLEQKRLRPEGAIFLIPARLEVSDLPTSLSSLQYVNLYESDGWSRITEALKHAQRQQSLLRQQGEARGSFTVWTRAFEEHWDGMPGYSANLKYPEFRDGVSSATCEQLNVLFKAQCLSELYRLRSSRTDQNPSHWGNTSPEFSTNKEFMEYKITFLSATAMSVVYTVGGYGAGAAHGYTKYKTKSFFLNPPSEMFLGAFFKYPNYREKLGDVTREALRKKAWERNKIVLSEKQLENGTTFWPNVEFTFDESGLTLYFQEYQIGPYAIGRWEVTLPFDNLREILRSDLHQLIGFP